MTRNNTIQVKVNAKELEVIKEESEKIGIAPSTMLRGFFFLLYNDSMYKIAMLKNKKED